MEKCDCEENCGIGCNFFGVLTSIIVAVVFGIFFSMGLIVSIINYIRISLILSVIALAMLFSVLLTGILIRDYNPLTKCICKIGKCLFFGAIGTLIVSTIAAIIDLTTVSLITILTVALSVFFFVFMIIGIISLVNCLLNKGCKN